MKIAYQSTIEEATETAFRMAERVGGLRRWMCSGLVWAPFIFIILFLLRDELVAKLVLGGISTVLFVVYGLLNYKNELRKRIRKTLIRALGTDKPLLSEYELDDNGLIFRKLGQELRFAWDNIASIKESETSIEVIMAPSGIAMIPTRIFSSPEQQRIWMSFIQEHARRDKPVQAMASHPVTEARMPAGVAGDGGEDFAGDLDRLGRACLGNVFHFTVVPMLRVSDKCE